MPARFRCQPSLPTTNNSPAKELRFLLDEIGDVEVVGTATNGLEALDLIEKLDPALAFLDIQMPGLDGLGVVRRLREHQIEPPHIIFSTAFDQFAVDAFKLEAMDYLLKPVDRERLAATLARARRAVADRITEAVAGGTQQARVYQVTPTEWPAQPGDRAGRTCVCDHRQRRHHAGGGTG